MTHSTRILLWTDTPAPYAAAIAAAGLDARVQLSTLPRQQQPDAAQMAETEVILGWGAPPGLLPRMPRLRWVQSLTAGVEGWLALPDLPEGVVLTCARGTHGDSMPENILGALFHITKGYADIADAQRQSQWKRRIATPLNGQVLGILGLGAIGAEVARLASALRMEVIGTRRNPAPMPHVREVFPPGGTDAVLAEADYVLLLLPATNATENFINTERLARMKRNAWLLNFGRGSAIVDADLIAAVTEKRIAGAILDVFREEPLPASHPFWSTPGIMVLPHIGGMHPERDRVVASLFTDNLRRHLDGIPLRELVDRRIGY